MLVERAREVAFEEFVLANGLREEAPDESEVAQVVRVDLRRLVDREQISLTPFEERIIRIEDFPREDQEPLAKQAACILPFFSYTENSNKEMLMRYTYIPVKDVK